MTLLLLALILNPGSRLTTSLYTFNRIGSYSVSDLYLNYAFSRYNFNLNMERRTDESGLRSFSVDIDSVFRSYRLTAGEKHYTINAPMSTTLTLWGLTMTSPRLDVFCGKSRDPNALLPPTFHNNNYTFGAKTRWNLAYRMPAEFYFVKKNDQEGEAADNNSLGTNLQYVVNDNTRFYSQIASNLSTLGPGAAFNFGGVYTGQQYGVQAAFRKVFRNFVTPSNQLTDPGNWLQINAYGRPLYWLTFGSDFSYSSLQDVDMGLNFTIQRSPLPELGYGASFSRRSEIISQYAHAGWRYRASSIDALYNWSVSRNIFTLRLTQDIRFVQVYGQLQLREADVYQVGAVCQLSPRIRAKTYFNATRHQSSRTNAVGADISATVARNLKLGTSYETVSQNGHREHTVSFSLTNSVLFDQTGLGFIGGRVFMDLNRNGLFDTLDRVVPDIEVLLDGREAARTDRDGNYRFTFVPTGPHQIAVNFGCLPAEIGAGKRAEKLDIKFLSKARVNFPLGELGYVEGFVFNDDNKNGKRDSQETGVPNVVIALNGFMTTSDAKGKYRFANLPAGSYAISVKVLPPETHLTVPGDIIVHIEPGSRLEAYNIGVLAKERPIQKKTFGEVKVAETKKPPAIKPPVKVKPPVEKKTVNAADIKKLYDKGVMYFIGRQYTKALQTFNQVLAMDPGHKGAQDYKRRTELRLKALKEE